VRWVTHKRITFLIVSSKFRFLFNNKEFIDGLSDGLIEPDIYPDIYLSGAIGVPHHTIRANKLVEYYACLSLYFLRNDRHYDSGKALGRAIHYIQDMTFDIGKPFLKFYHDQFEEEVNRISEDKAYLRDIIDEVTTTDDLTEIAKVKKAKVPKDAVREATKRTYQLLSWFVSESERPIDLSTILRKLRVVKVAKAIASTIAVTMILWIIDRLLQSFGGLVKFFLTGISYALNPEYQIGATIFLLLFSSFIVGICYAVVSSIKGIRTKVHWEAFKAGVLKIDFEGAIY